MRLVISEKNIAAKRIAEILAVGKPTLDKVYTTPVYRFRRDGEDWVSVGLKGHIMKVDFPPEHDGVELKRWSLESLPTLVKAPVLKLPSEKGIIQSIKNLAKKADEVIIATDFDREGELIGADARANVREVNADVPIRRARFSAITPKEIEGAFSELGDISDNLAQAGESRQDIDLVWGAVLTRFLTLSKQLKTRKPYDDVLSAGRVQTPTLKLIVDREREREAFAPEDYWQVKGAFAKDGQEFGATHATDRFTDEAAAEAAHAACATASEGTVTSVERTRRQIKPPAPFNTTSLMAAAASEGLTPARTMNIAETLYMNGLISYPRVDNTVYSSSLDLRALLKTLQQVPVYHSHAGALLAKQGLTPTRGAKEATDHPPVHPTGVGDPDKLKPQEWKLYNLVARRFMATLSDAAVLEATKVGIDVAGEPFVARGDVVVVPGFRAVYPYSQKKEEHLPPLAEGEGVTFLGATLEAKQTQPPSRYSQGKLIQEMEKLGLGTKATRHDMIQTLYDRKYVTGDPIAPSCKGRAVIDALSEYAERITTPGMTVELEQDMDAIADGRERLDSVVSHSRELLAGVMQALLPLDEQVGEKLKNASDEDAKVGTCPASGHDLLIKYSPANKSYFVGCQGYPECGVTYPLPRNSKFAAVEELCPVCGTPQVRVMKFKQPARLMCLSTECPTKKGPDEGMDIGACPTGDGGRLRVMYSAVGNRFARCEEYETCKTSYPLPRTGEITPTDEVCEPCRAPRVVISTRKGPWKICVDPDCPTKERNGASSGKRGRGGKAAAGKSAGRKRKSPSKGASSRRSSKPAESE